jgi:hypothetical protein
MWPGSRPFASIDCTAADTAPQALWPRTMINGARL